MAQDDSLPPTLEAAGSLINTGMLDLAPPGIRYRRMVVVGAARGGTSMIAGALQALGAHLGDQARPPVFEDLRLSLAFESGDRPAFDRAVADYDRHACWAWKRPSSIQHLDRVTAWLPDALWIVVFRDPLAIALRNRISARSRDHIASMRHALASYGSCLDALERTGSPHVLISCEKAVRHREAMVDVLAARMAIPPDARQRSAATEFVREDPRDYLGQTRIGEARGHLDLVKRDRVRGWAADRGHGRPVVVEVLAGGRVVATVLADRHRPDLAAAGAHPDGNAGFDIPIDPSWWGDGAPALVGVRVQGTSDQLAGSPKQLPAAAPLLGRVDRIAEGEVHGWAYRPGEAPVTVEVVFDGQVVATGRADHPRPDLVQAGIHPTGYAGFGLALPNGMPGTGAGLLVRTADHRQTLPGPG
ncbi:MAG: hypothetical protein RLZZ127_1296 [Planctomycetota bacterium]|jgi:hypothetical protein